MPLQALPGTAEAYAAAQRAVIRRTVARAGALWRRMGAEFDASYSGIELDLLEAVAAAQLELAIGAQEYVPQVLVDTDSRAATAPVAAADPGPLVGRAGDGRPLESLLYGEVTHAKQLVAATGPGLAVPEALRRSGRWLTMATSTVLSDTGRQSEALAIGVRPRVKGYVRMLNPPSCSRCVILAGARYRAATPFQRHPKCDCRHIPAAEAVAGDMTVDPLEYFDSLSTADQDRVFGAESAEAIRRGADMGQIVNARRGMSSAQVGGRTVRTTLEGTTRRGVAYQYLSPSGTTVRAYRSASGRVVARRAASRPRLMPETIRAIATDQADYLRLLRANGYLRG